MKRISIILLLISIFLTGCATYQQGKSIESHNDNMVENINVVEVHEVGLSSDSLGVWLGSYEQSGTLWDEIRLSVKFYIYWEDEKYYGYLCVNGREAETSCYFDERILTEIKGNQDMIEVYFLERQQLIQGCYHEEFPDIFSAECDESKLGEAIRTFENQDILFTLMRDEDIYSVIEGQMSLGKNQGGLVNNFSQCNRLTIDKICDNDNEVFLKIFRQNGYLNEKEQPEYNCYDNNGELILNLYLNPEEERGVGRYYGQTQISRYITKFELDSWQSGAWQDNKYLLIRAGEEAAIDLDEYQEYTEYNDQGQITSFYSEGIITGWGEPSKEKLVQIEFCYRDDGTLERKSCHYNHRLYGTTRQAETFYFNDREQLNYATAYTTHGMLSDYYFYEDGKEEPIYCLTLDHMGHGCYGELVKYDDTSANNEQLPIESQMWKAAN